MTAYLGRLGELQEIEAPALQVPTDRPASFRTTLGGTTRGQVGPRARRSWSVEVTAAEPEQLAPLAAFVEGEHGLGPFAWVDQWAQATNVVSPRGSVLAMGQPPSGVMVAGSVALADGAVAGRHLAVPTEGPVVLPRVAGAVEPVPVVPGRPVTVSVYASGTAVQLRPVWVDAAGAQTPGEWSAATSLTAVTRVPVSVTVPATAVAVLLEVSGAGIVTRPAVTWSETVLPWYPGQGAPAVVVLGHLTTPILAGTDDGDQLAGMTFTVQEVG